MSTKNSPEVVGLALAALTTSAVALLLAALIWFTPATRVSHKSDLGATSTAALKDYAMAYIQQGAPAGLIIKHQEVLGISQDGDSTVVRVRVTSNELDPVVLSVYLHRGIYSVEQVKEAK